MTTAYSGRRSEANTPFEVYGRRKADRGKGELPSRIDGTVEDHDNRLREGTYLRFHLRTPTRREWPTRGRKGGPTSDHVESLGEISTSAPFLEREAFLTRAYERLSDYYADNPRMRDHYIRTIRDAVFPEGVPSESLLRARR